MTNTEYFTKRGLIPTLIKESLTTKAYLITLYQVVDEMRLSQQPKELQNTLIPSYSYYIILYSDQVSGKILNIETYLTEEEALEIFLNNSTTA